jgi:hypothetical protein
MGVFMKGDLKAPSSALVWTKYKQVLLKRWLHETRYSVVVESLSKVVFVFKSEDA